MQDESNQKVKMPSIQPRVNITTTDMPIVATGISATPFDHPFFKGLLEKGNGPFKPIPQKRYNNKQRMIDERKRKKQEQEELERKKEEERKRKEKGKSYAAMMAFKARIIYAITFTLLFLFPNYARAESDYDRSTVRADYNVTIRTTIGDPEEVMGTTTSRTTLKPVVSSTVDPYLKPFNISRPIDVINPWLSACDLKFEYNGICEQASGFPSGVTSPGLQFELECPKECPFDTHRLNIGCVTYLNKIRREAICDIDPTISRRWMPSYLHNLRLPNCCERPFKEAFSPTLLEIVLRGGDDCFHIVDKLIEADKLAGKVTCEFSQILRRFDCRQVYSVKHSCTQCLEAYRRWVCATLLPYFNGTNRIRPCRTACELVEKTCPYFLPENRHPAQPTQYAGEPTFLCKDLTIPDTSTKRARSLYPDDDTCCVDICEELEQGYCIRNEKKCKVENLTSYDEQIDNIMECPEPEQPPVTVSECQAVDPYSSPDNLGPITSNVIVNRPSRMLVYVPLIYTGVTITLATVVTYTTLNYFYSDTLTLIAICFGITFILFLVTVSIRQKYYVRPTRFIIKVIRGIYDFIRLVMFNFCFWASLYFFTYATLLFYQHFGYSTPEEKEFMGKIFIFFKLGRAILLIYFIFKNFFRFFTIRA